MKDINVQTPQVQRMIQELEACQDPWNEKAVQLCQEILAKAEADKNVLVQGYCHARLARFYYRHSDQDRCNKHIQLGIPMQDASGDGVSLAISCNLLGIDAVNHGDYAIALEYFQRALQSDKTNPRSTGNALVNIGHIYYEVEDLDTAIRYCHDGRQYVESSGDLDAILLALEQEATYDIWSGRIQEAEELIPRIQKILTQLEEKYPDVVYPDLAETMIYYYDAQGDSEKRNAAAEDFLCRLEKFDEYLDYAEDAIWIADTMLNVGNTEYVGRLLDHMRQPVMDSEIYHIMLEFIQRDIRYNQMIGNVDRCQQLESDYVDISIKKKKEDVRIYRMNVNVRTKIAELEIEKKRMEDENRRLMRAATIDPLTQVANRALMNQKAEEMFEEAYQQRKTLAVEMMDVDFFKQFNDTYGHQEGDRCLQRIASILKSLEDQYTFVARYGGDEFFIIYLSLTDNQVLAKAESIRQAVAELSMDNLGAPSGKVTVSQGIRNSIPKMANKVWDYTYAADNALYQVKKTNKGNILLLHRAEMNEAVLADSTME